MNKDLERLKRELQAARTWEDFQRIEKQIEELEKKLWEQAANKPPQIHEGSMFWENRPVYTKGEMARRGSKRAGYWSMSRHIHPSPRPKPKIPKTPKPKRQPSPAATTITIIVFIIIIAVVFYMMLPDIFSQDMVQAEIGMGHTL